MRLDELPAPVPAHIDTAGSATARQPLARRFSAWLFRDHGAEPTPIVLTQRRVFVLPTRAGLAFAGALAAMLIGAINYQLPLGFALTFLLAGLGHSAILHTFRNLARLEIEAGTAAPVFCGDPATTALLDQLRTAVAEEDGRLLEELVHPERGLRVRLNWWNPEVLIAGNDVRQLFRAEKRQEWGTEDGSGLPIRGSFNEVVLPRLERDLLPATDRRCDEGVFGPTAGLTNLPEGYEAVRFYSLHRPAPAEQELDWGTWLVGIERWEGRYYVSYLVHYRWEI